MIVANRRPLSEEFWIHADTEVTTRLFLCALLEQRNHGRFDRSGKNCAPDTNEMIRVRRTQKITDLFSRSRYMSEAQTAVVIAGGAHTDEGDIGFLGPVHRRP